MPNEDRSFTDSLNAIHEKLGRMDAKIDDIKDIRIKAESAEIRAGQALQHIERIDSDLQDLKQMSQSQKVATTQEIATVEKRIHDQEQKEIANKRWIIGLAIPTILTLFSLLDKFLV
jgi:hypothetical protein